MRERSLAARDIGELPPVAEPERKEDCRLDFRRFGEVYHAETFSIAWSPDHLRVIAKIEEVILRGGTFAIAMPRGFGKSSLCETGCEWSMLYGHRLFVGIVGPDQKLAKRCIASIRMSLENNELYLADFPEVCYPIRRLDGINQRRLVYHGRNVEIRFKADQIVLPNLNTDGVVGGVVMATSLTGQVRGMKHKCADGQVLRPAVVILDDPQKDELARNPLQVEKLERTIRGSVLGLSGPKTSIGAICPCTVIAKDDLADRLLDHEKNPSWQGERTKMVYSFPSDEKLWADYKEIRGNAMRACARSQAGRAEADRVCNEFYLEHREAMDAGAVVAWPEKFYPHEVSGIQHAMNIRIDLGDRAFFAEYQNDPLLDTPVDGELLTADEIAKKVNGMVHGIAPLDTTRITAFIDVQDAALYYVVIAWNESFSGAILDYGTFPDQKLAYFGLKDIRRTLALEFPSAGGAEGRWFKGLTALLDWMSGDWYLEDGTAKRVDRCLIDANYAKSAETVYRFCRTSPHASILLPSHGKYVGAQSMPYSEYRRRPGERIGLNWRLGISPNKRQRCVTFDTNFWKTFIHERLRVEHPEPSSLALFSYSQGRGRKRQPADHRMIAEQLSSEYRVRTSGRGREVDEWRLRANGLDNHLLDAVTGAAVAASIEGVKLPTDKTEKRAPVGPQVYRW